MLQIYMYNIIMDNEPVLVLEEVKGGRNTEGSTHVD